ncbi:hypothetical protein [Halodesulfovibrio sp. MK-HDV]|uniref:hypothetical protein n=1 Tax=Halodesulfovibrio sp. MK-HDV TaxID=2599925 RepID=UPI001369143D|nr:hypothetical protein [Halodesulfovibrio sp. MK-HDV]
MRCFSVLWSDRVDSYIVDDDIEICIKNLGRLGSAGMCETNKIVLDIMVSK